MSKVQAKHKCFFTKKTKVKFSTQIKYIYDHKYDGLVKRFIFVNVITISFEMLISVYLLEIVAVFSKYFLNKPDEISLLKVFIILPFVTMIVLAVFFGMCAAFYFVKQLYIYLHDYKNVEATEDNYKMVISRYRKQLITIQVLGSASYMISTIIIPMIFVNKYSDNIAHPQLLIISMIILGSILGITWNLTGICRNQRFMWTTLIEPFSDDENIKYLERAYNYKYYVLNAVGILISIIEIFAIFVFVLFNLHESFLKEETLASIATSYGFLFVYFVAFVGIYIKYVVKHLFCTWKDNGIFPSMKRIMK